MLTPFCFCFCFCFSLPLPFLLFLTLVSTLQTQIQPTLAASRTSPPSGAVVVRAGTTTSGEFPTLNAALNSLPNDSSSRSIFIYPGTYVEQVDITRSGPLTIYGYTTNTQTYTSNAAVLSFDLSLSTSTSDDASGTLRVHKDDFSMYNVNVTNTFGPGSQAIAISQYGSRVGLYACAFLGYQDTLYANEGTQVYLRSYIEGAIDFIFGRSGLAYFGGNTIGVKDNGSITASGRQSDDDGSYVFNQNTITLAPDAASDTVKNFFFGRPWSDFAKVIFKSTTLLVSPDPALWQLWDGNTTSVDHVLNADFNTTGPGATGLSRASWAVELSASEAAGYSISSAVGSDWATWVDMAYFV